MAEVLVFDPNTPPPCIDPNFLIIAQYSNSKFSQFGYLFQKELQCCSFFDDFYKNVWNINTCNAYGLKIWGIIVGATRITDDYTGFFWGYNEQDELIIRPYNPNDDTDKNTTWGMFRDLQKLKNETSLGDEGFRKNILAKAYHNISDFSIPSLNYILMNLFGDNAKNKLIWVVDHLDMTFTIQTNFFFSIEEISILQTLNNILAPAGISYNFKEITK